MFYLSIFRTRLECVYYMGCPESYELPLVPLVFTFSNMNLNWRSLLQTPPCTCLTAFHPWIDYNSPLSCWQGYDSFHTSLFIKICTCAFVSSHFKVQLLTIYAQLILVEEEKQLKTIRVCHLCNSFMKFTNYKPIIRKMF